MQAVGPTPSFLPLYEQIRALLTESLSAGEWKPGEPIPSEQQLAQRFKVSQGTVRKAIEALATDHLVVRRQGKGTYVATHSEPGIRYRFLRMAADRGGRIALTSKLLSVTRARATRAMAGVLGIKGGEAVTRIKRVLQLDRGPLIYDDIALPSALFPDLDARGLAEFKGSFYTYYETKHAIRTIRAEERLKAVAADAEAAAALQIEPGTPLLRVDRVAYTYGEKPVEWRRGLCLTDHHHYFNVLS